MKVLFISPCADEIVDNRNKSVFFIKSLVSQISKCQKKFETTVIDLSDVYIDKISVSSVSDIIEKMEIPVKEYDIIHTFSIFPFIFRSFFPQLIISSFDIDSVDKKYKTFVPEKDDPGYARYDISAIEISAICELYNEIYNNRRKFDSRPWGWWKSLVLSGSYKVKQIYVAPDGKLSLQTHKFRSEIWLIAQGNGWVTIGNERLNAEKGSIFNIKRGEIHRAEGSQNGMYIIELQIGDYLGEDDIIRLEDIYGRS